MPERDAHLDLLADHVVRRMQALFGGALRETVGTAEVLEVLGIPSDPMGTPGDPLGLERLSYADGLLHDVIGYVQSKWADARRIESLSPSSAPKFDDPGDFD